MIEQILNNKQQVIHSFCKQHHVALLILFGSIASGTHHGLSDVDLAVQTFTGTSISKLHLIQELESIFDQRRIDLTIVTKDTDPLLLFEIFSSGLLLYENTRRLFENNRLKAWHLYQDTMPLRRFEKTYITKRIRALANVT